MIKNVRPSTFGWKTDNYELPSKFLSIMSGIIYIPEQTLINLITMLTKGGHQRWQMFKRLGFALLLFAQLVPSQINTWAASKRCQVVYETGTPAKVISIDLNSGSASETNRQPHVLYSPNGKMYIAQGMYNNNLTLTLNFASSSSRLIALN